VQDIIVCKTQTKIVCQTQIDICVARLVRVRDMHFSTSGTHGRDQRTCDMFRSHVKHVCNITHSHVQHVCDMTHSYAQ